ncbi:MAG: hypothetical protein PHP22_09555 [Oscillospiraceae bacterium]|jgi:hypothetical protein|nr:hypothetical protein [Oscillospiraceae bacterium]
MDNKKESTGVDIKEEVALPVISEDEKDNADSLPKGTVHCFPANPKQILIRRVATVVIILLCVAGAIYSLTSNPANYYLLFLIGLAFIVSALVFIQTFLIAGFRVAVDYEQNEVVLRYMFRKLKIPFEEFDSRDGEPDRAQKAIGKLNADKGGQRMYLILDNVHDDACYQTSSYDLASVSDFLKLKEEAEQIARAYKAREKFEAEQKAQAEQDAADEAKDAEERETESINTEKTEDSISGDNE